MKLNEKFKVIIISVCLLFILIFLLDYTFADKNLSKSDEFSEFIVDSTTPEGVTINMFDYWITDTEKPQYDNQNTTIAPTFPTQTNTHESVFNPELGINKNHLFLFRQSTNQPYGIWNANTRNYEIYNSGLVQRTLGPNGYPTLNLNEFMLNSVNRKINYHFYPTTKTNPWPTWQNFAEETSTNLGPAVTDSPNKAPYLEHGENAMRNNKGGLATESLEYLFNPNYIHPGKISYTNVKGLFKNDGNGYYYFDCNENYAALEYDINDVDPNQKVIDGAKINLYDKVLYFDDAGPKAQFFPFNKVSDFFYVSNGTLTEKEGLKATAANEVENANHFFGVEMTVPFLVPENGILELRDEEGKLRNEEIIFDFTGDDDLWVFVDDVLVLDISGYHTGMPGYINFSTGEVYRETSQPSWSAKPENIKQSTTMADQFKAAGKYNDEEWEQTEDGNWILASNTKHTMKVYYLERGHYASTINIKFNLQTQMPIDLKKINRDEEGIGNVEFDLYQAQNYKPTGNAADVTLSDVKQYIKPENIIASLTTDENGQATFKEKNSATDKLINFSSYYNNGNGTQIYILKEKNSPSDYQPLANEIVLRYDPNFQMLVVNNKFETGAYANFKSTIYGNNQITYSNLNETTGDIPYNSSRIVSDADQEAGLIIGVPLTEKLNGWKPIYGSNMKGFSIPDETYGNINDRILAAILYQIYDASNPSWYLNYNNNTKRLEGTFDQMPGTADRYKLKSFSNPNANMQMSYGIIKGNGLKSLGIEENDARSKYEEINYYLIAEVNKGKNIETVIKETIQKINSTNNFELVNIDRFSRNFSSTIVVPNDTRELIINKIDENNNPINGVVFSLYKSKEDAEKNINAISTGTTGKVNNQNGVLIFTPNVITNEGYSYMSWTGASIGTRYYLKEVSAPKDYIKNPTIIPIVLGAHSIYADAGTENDGVSVKAGIGRLAKTMYRYAIDRNVDITLRDIKLIAQTQNSDNFIVNSWQDSENGETLELHTYPNSNATYTLHKGLEGEPYIETETGFIRTKVLQNYGKHNNEDDEHYVETLETKVDEDLTDIYRIVNIVVIKNKLQNRTISGIAFEDLNNDNLYNADYDSLIKDIKVSLINPIDNSIVDETKTNEEGLYKFEHLQLNKYIIKFELQDGYNVIEKGTEYNSNKANKDGTTDEIIFLTSNETELDIKNINLGLKIIKLLFTKIEANNKDSPLKNSGLFELYEYVCDIDDLAYSGLVKENTECFSQIGETISTDENGIIKFEKLTSEYYRLVEKEAPSGFIRPTGEWNITFKDSDIRSIDCVGGSENGTCPAFIRDDNMLYLPNIKIASIPNSGGLGRTLFTVIGVIIMGIGLILLNNERSYKQYTKK